MAGATDARRVVVTGMGMVCPLGGSFEQVFEQVCFRPPGNPADRQAVSDIAEIFEQDSSMQEVFAQTAMYCMENP